MTPICQTLRLSATCALLPTTWPCLPTRAAAAVAVVKTSAILDNVFQCLDHPAEDTLNDLCIITCTVSAPVFVVLVKLKEMEHALDVDPMGRERKFLLWEIIFLNNIFYFYE